jgi:hypothetical protein
MLHSRSDTPAAIVGELHSRGLATSRENAAFQWNSDRVDKVTQPFAAVADNVTNNQRVNYTRAGGKKVVVRKMSLITLG